VKHRKELYNTFCEKNLNYNRGDDFLQIGWFDFSALFGFMAKGAPKNIVFELTLTAFDRWVSNRLIPFGQWIGGKGELL
jgi:hypothetical protein